MSSRIVREYKGEFGAFFQKEAQKSADMFDKAVVTDGIPRWTTNNRIPPMDLLELWVVAGKAFDFDKSVRQSEIESSESLRQYREAQMNHKPSDEELNEMRATFGEGVAVVDILTGRKIQL